MRQKNDNPCRGHGHIQDNLHDKRYHMKLLRNFIEEALYAKNTGYFTSSSSRLCDIPPINFKALKGGKSEYRAILNSHHQSEWFTPSELFKPWYGYAIADQIIKTAVTDKIVIYEVGAGTGSLASSIIEKLTDCNRKCEYKTIEISKAFADVQRSKNLDVIQGSFMDIQIIEHRPCFVLAFEVWDNLAHDRMRLFDTFQAVLDDDLEQHYVPMTDPCLVECVKAIDACYPKYLETNWIDTFLTRTAFIPTGLFQFIKTLNKHFPQCQLIVSDFDTLPTMQEGKGAPRVQVREEGETVELSRMTFCPGRGRYLLSCAFPLGTSTLTSHMQA